MLPTTPYGAAALASEIAKIKVTAGGGRNGTLNEVWLKLNHRIATGHLDYDQAHQAVWDAITPWFGQPGGDGRPFTVSEARATMRSAENGARMRPNTSIPEPGAPPDLAWLDLPRQAAPVVSTPAPDAVPASMPAAVDYSHLYITVRDLDDLPAPSPLIDGVIDDHTLFSISGRGGTYKSFIAWDWLACLATGKQWLGRDVQRRKGLLVVGEGAYGLAQRRNAWETAWHATIDPEWLHIRRAPVNLFRAAGSYLDLLARVEAERYDVVVFDTLQRMTSGAESNSNRDAGLVIERLAEIRSITDGAVGYVAHAAKNADAGTRGSSAWEDDVDTVWRVRRDEDEDSGLTDVILTMAKRKDGPDGQEFRLRPEIVAGTDSLVLKVPGASLFDDARHPRYSLEVLEELARPTAAEGLSQTRVKDILGIPSWKSMTAAANWLVDQHLATLVGKGARQRLKATGYGLKRLAETKGEVVRGAPESGEVHNAAGQSVVESGEKK